MKRKMRKVISLVLALSMCLSLMQMTAFATDDTSAAGEAGYTQETPSAETTQETPAAETTEETPAAETTEETPPAETAKETPAAGDTKDETAQDSKDAKDETAQDSKDAKDETAQDSKDAKDETAQDSKDETKDETAKDTKDETETEEAESVEITGSESAKGVTVSVDAPAGAFPGGTTLSITPITLFNNFLGIPMNNIKGSIADTMDEDTELDGAVAFDITFMYDGAEVQPADGYTVDVQFVVDDANKAIGTEANELQVYHLEDASGEAAPVGEPAPFDAEAGNNTVSVDAKSFSIYAVIGGKTQTARLNNKTYSVALSSGTAYFQSDSGYSNHKWSSSDTSVATVSANEENVTVTLLKAGKTTITHTYGYVYSGTESFTLKVEGPTVTITDSIVTDGKLTATLDGITGDATYQWYRKGASDTTYSEVSGATGASYTVSASDAQASFYVVATVGTVNYQSAAYKVDYYSSLQNGGFETPNYYAYSGTGHGMYYDCNGGDDDGSYFMQIPNGTSGLYWKTTGIGSGSNLGHDIELVVGKDAKNCYGTTRDNLTDANGHANLQFAELNCEAYGALYQDVLTTPGTVLHWGLEHSGRWGDDTMQVIIMGTKDVPANWNPAYQVNTDPSVQATITDGSDDWNYYTDASTGAGGYVVPAGQYVTRFYFVSVSATNSTHGNLLDNISFSTEIPTPPPTMGNLTITKTLNGVADADTSRIAAGTFTFTAVSGTHSYSVSLPTADGAWSTTIPVYTGTTSADYTVTETTPAETLTANGNSYAYNNTTYAVGTAAAAAGKTATVNVAASGTGSVTFANSYDAVSTNVGFYFDKVWTNTVGTAMTVTLTDGTTDYTFTVDGNASGTFGSSNQYAWTKTVDTANDHIWNIAVSGLPGGAYSIASETAAGYTPTITQGSAAIAAAEVINPCSELTISNIDSSFIAVKQTTGRPYIIWTRNPLSKTQQDMLAAKVCSYGQGFNNDGKGYVYFYGTSNAAVAAIVDDTTGGKTVTFGAHSAWAKILYGTYTATAPTITNTPSTGSLTVTKTISGLTAARTGDYTLKVTITNTETNVAESHTITIGTARTQGSWTFTDLAPGNYTVTESDVTGIPDFYTVAASGNTTTANATVVSNQTASASLTNNYQRTAPTVVLGSITVTKTIEGITGPYSVEVTVGDVTQTINIAAGATTGTATFTGLDAGTYNVTETFPTVSGYHKADGSVESGTVNLSLGDLDYMTNTETVSSGTATLDNKYAHDTGIVTVAKTSTIDGVSDTAGTYTFGLYTKSGSDYTQVGTIDVTGGVNASFAAVDTGATYYVKELNADKTDYSLSTAYTLGGAAAAANADGYVEIANLNAAVTVGCANTYTLNTVNVSGTKTWDNVDAYRTATGADAGPANSALTITLYADGSAVDKVPTWNGNTYTFSGLRAANNGTAIKYTVAETAMSGFDKQTIDGSTCFVEYERGTSGLVYGFWKSAQRGNDFTNAWVNAGEEGTGTFTVVKNGVKDGTTSPLKGVTFTLYNYSEPATGHIGTQVAERTTTNSAEEYTDAVFSGLIAGSYILVETSQPAGYTGAGPWTVTVSSNGKTYVETQEPSADNGNVFTNIYNWAVSIFTGTDPATGWNASASTLTVANNYAVTDVTPTSLTLTAAKTLSGKTLTANAFNFAVTENGTTVATGTNDANGLVTFSAINYTTSAAAGEHTYTVSETSTSGSGITVDDSTYTVVANVTYTDNGDGTATMAVTSVTENRQTLAYPYNVGTFRNTYAVTDVTPASLTLTAAKTLSGKTLTANAFNFAVTENGTTVATGTNDANGLVTFSAINYNAQTAVGTHTYTVSETSTNGNGITVDNAIFTVDATVTYTDNGDGTAAMAVTSVTENRQTLASPYNVGTFRNTYAVTDVTPTSLTLTGTKTLSGKALTDNEFNFAVTENGTTVATGTNDADGLITFSAINYNAQTAVGTHTYTVSETSTNGNGITVDNAIFTVDATVTYTDNGDGTAAMAVTSVTENDQTLASPYNVGTFRNTYAVTDVTPTSLTLTGTKTLSGKTLTANAFNFAVTENGTTVATGTNDANGLVTFSAINYTTSAAAGEHTYTVSETSTSGSGITVDDSSYTVVANVTYTDNGDGTATMAVTSVTENRQTLAYPYNVGTFRNTYAVTDVTPASLTLTAAKTLSGKTLTANAFNFAVTENGMTVATGTNDADGLITFSAINYTTSAAAGEHTYTVSETSTNGNGITVDGTTYNVVANVTYTDNGDGTATMAVTSVTENRQALATPYNVGTFANTYTAQPVSLALTGTKMLSGKALTAGMFRFNLYETGSTFATAGLTPVTVSNDARGNIAFETKTFSTAGTYYFVAQESAGSNGGVTYDTTARNITVVVSDNGLGNLVITSVNGAAVTNNTYSVGTFTNTYAVPDTASASLTLTGTKALTGRSMKAMTAGEFTFKVMEGETQVSTGSVTADGSITFTAISYNNAGIGDHTYTVTEDAGTVGGVTYDSTAYTVTVTVSDDGNGGITVGTPAYAVGTEAKTGIAFTNTYSAAPASFTIGGTKTYNQTLTDNMFSFRLYGAEITAVPEVQADTASPIVLAMTDAAPETVNNTGAAFTFAAKSYTAAGDYWYIVDELNGGQTINGITYDGHVYAVKVSVTDNGSGALAAAKTVYALTPSDNGYTVGDAVTSNTVAFTNSYASVIDTAGTSINLTGKKVLTGTSMSDKEFSFQVTENGTVVAQGTNDANGNITFSAISYAAPGTHTYAVTELNGGIAYVSYDTTSYTVTVTVTGTDNGLGTTTLSAAAVYPEGEVVFHNAFEYDGGDDPKPPVVIPDPDVPHGDNPDTPSIPDTPTEIPDEPTPHAEAPKTGDNNSLWLFIALASGIGIVALNLGGRKRKEDDKQ